MLYDLELVCRFIESLRNRTEPITRDQDLIASRNPPHQFVKEKSVEANIDQLKPSEQDRPLSNGLKSEDKEEEKGVNFPLTPSTAGSSSCSKDYWRNATPTADNWSLPTPATTPTPMLRPNWFERDVGSPLEKKTPLQQDLSRSAIPWTIPSKKGKLRANPDIHVAVQSNKCSNEALFERLTNVRNNVAALTRYLQERRDGLIQAQMKPTNPQGSASPSVESEIASSTTRAKSDTQTSSSFIISNLSGKASTQKYNNFKDNSTQTEDLPLANQAASRQESTPTVTFLTSPDPRTAIIRNCASLFHKNLGNENIEFEETIEHRLRSFNGRCIATKMKDGYQCTVSTGTRKADLDAALDSLQNWSGLDDRVERFIQVIELAVCSLAHRGGIKNTVEHLVRTPKLHIVAANTSSIPLTDRYSIGTPLGEAPKVDSGFWPWFPCDQRGRSVGEVLKDLLVSELSKDEYQERKSYIYVYRFSRDSRLRKIGVTTDATVRFQYLEDGCKRRIERLYPRDLSEARASRHGYRLEALIHAELRDYRHHERRCEGCKGEHREWFKATDEHIMNVIEKWTSWIESEPYAKDPRYHYHYPERWSLKYEHRMNLQQLCRPLEIPRVL